MTPLRADRFLEKCLDSLRGLGKGVRAEVVTSQIGHASRIEAKVRLKFGVKAAPLYFEVRTTRTHLSGPLTSGFIEEARGVSGRWLLCAPYISGAMGQRLAAERLCYVDAVGNCHIEIDGLVVAHAEGKKRPRGLGPRAPGIKSHQLLFALLAQPELVEAPARKVALAAGIGKSAAYELIGQLNQQGLLDYNPGGVGLRSARALLDRWLSAYADVVRPSWLRARCQSAITDPRELESLIARICEDSVWALGGSAAASRMLSVARGTETVVHMAEVPADLLLKLRAVPAPNGSLTVLQTPGTLAYQGVSAHLAHPLLIFSELLSSSEPHVARTASELRRRFLPELAAT